MADATRPPEPAAIAARIRESIGVLATDLEIVRIAAGKTPGCEDAVKRIQRQVAELNALADEVYVPKE